MASKTKTKGGSFTNEERQFILDNQDTMSVDDIGKQLNRKPLLIEKFIQSHTTLPTADNKGARSHLRRSSFYKHLQQEFTPDELEYIQEQYVKYVQQLKEGVAATEEVQLLSLIKVEVLQQRNLKNKQKISDNAGRYQQMVNDMMVSVSGNFAKLDKDDQQKIMDLNNSIQACMNAEGAKTNEYIELQKQHNELTKKLMASRDQRVNEIVSMKTTWSGYMKQLQDRDKQMEESRRLNITKLATEREFERLSQPHRYADKSVDNPVLMAEVVEKFDKEEPLDDFVI